MVAKRLPPIGFLSYVHFDDRHDDGKLSEFCLRLSAEVRVQSGKEFPIFQDRNDIKWGQSWEERIERSLDSAAFLIPIVSPGYFQSASCKKELMRFAEREKALKRNDLVLPVYYVGSPILEDEGLRTTHEMAQIIAAHQWCDWRELRFEPFTSPHVGKTIASLAVQIRDALERGSKQRKSSGKQSRTNSRRTDQPQTTVSDTAVSLETGAETQMGSRPPVIAVPTMQTAPPTWVVDGMHRGDYLTIGQAIRNAHPGDRIVIKPGLYREGLVVDKPLEIIGEGDAEDVVIEATDSDGLRFISTMGRLSNLYIRQLGQGNWFGLNIAQGRLNVQNCKVCAQGSACIGIHDGADPRLRHNTIQSGRQHGILVFGNAQGTIEDNEVCDNGAHGLLVNAGGNPTIRNNRIFRNAQCGIAIVEDGMGTMEGNEVFENGAGVGVRDGANPVLRRNNIHHNRGPGIIVRNAGQGTFDGNEVCNNDGLGFDIRDGGNPTIRNNTIHDQNTGLLISKNGKGLIERNQVFNHECSGVEVVSDSEPTIVNNDIHHCRKGACVLVQGAKGFIARNRLHDSGWGVAVHSAGNPTVSNNHIRDMSVNGTMAYDGGLGQFIDNDIEGSQQNGIRVESGGSPIFQRNKVIRNYRGVHVSKDGAGTFEGNTVEENTMEDWNIEEGSPVKVEEGRA